MSALLVVEFNEDQLDFLQILGELHRLCEQATYEGDAMARYGVDLDEAQVKTAGIIAEHYGLTIEEIIEHMILTALQQAVMGITRPGMTPEEVNRAMTEHSERMVRELKARRGGGSKLIRP